MKKHPNTDAEQALEVDCRVLSSFGGHCIHPCLAGWTTACLVRLLFPFLHLFVSINKYKYSISRCRCPWKLGLLGMFLLKRLLTGKLGFDKSVFLFLLLINKARFMCELWAFFFFTEKLNNLARFQFFKCLILRARAGFRCTRASHGT